MSLKLLKFFYSCIDKKIFSFDLKTDDFTIQYNHYDYHPDIAIFKDDSHDGYYLFNANFIENYIKILNSPKKNPILRN